MKIYNINLKSGHDYTLLVSRIPKEMESESWYQTQGNSEYEYFLVVNESTFTSNDCGSHYSYEFYKHYFNGENTDYMPSRLGIPTEDAVEFMKNVYEKIYPYLSTI